MSYPETFRIRPLVAFVALALGAPAMALAADVVQLDTIEVIATTPLHSSGVSINQVPSNVQVVKGSALQEQQSLGLADYLSNNLLGVNVNETQNNPFQPDVNFHGFAASPLLGTPQGLSVYQDGVRVNEPFGDTVNWDLIPKNAIAGINLMPGSNPLFGLNTLGGALSIQTKSGDLFPGGAVQISGGSWGRRAAEAEFGGSASNGANYYVAANLFKEDGWRENSNTDVRQLFGKFGWKGEKTDFSISFAGADNDMFGNGYVPESLLKSVGQSSVYTQPDETKNKLGFVTGQFNHYFTDNLSLSSVAYYRHTRVKTYNADLSDYAADAPAQGVINQTSTRQNGYGITGQLSWTTEKNLLIGGAGYDRATIDFSQSSQLFNLFDAARGMDVAAGFADPSPVPVVNLRGTTHTWSVFATDTYNLTPKLALTASGRYNRTSVDNTDNLNPSTDPNYLGGSQTFQRFNPAVGLTYSPVSSLNFFGGYNEGSRAPSSIEIGCSNPDPAASCNLPNSMAGDPPILKQVVAKTWEGGVRGNIGNSTKWSLAAYTSENSNDIQFIANHTSGAGYFTNVGQTRRLGLDFGLNGKIGNFNWMAGYSFVRATYESDFDVVASANALADATGIIHVSPGDRIPGIPEHQLKLRGEYSVMPNWVVGANVLAFSSQYAHGNENNADPLGKINGYAVLNLDTRYSFGKSGWQLFAKATNVFDQNYYTGGLLGTNMFTGAGNTFDTTGTGATDRFLAPGAPRAGWVGLRYEFGGAKSSKVDVD